MSLRDLLSKNRSYRRFRGGELLPRQTLVELVELTRLCPSAANRQPLRYLIVCEPAAIAVLFAHLVWARALKNWAGPAEHERPSGYLVILADTRISDHYDTDVGIAAQSIMLGAVERGLGGCMIASIDRDAVRRDFRVPPEYDIPLVLALGVPNEKVVLEDAKGFGDVIYWRDAEGTHHVPKRTTDELVVHFN
jgi:nitroreductase